MRRSNGHWFCFLIVACLYAAFASAQRVNPRYTIAFKSYAPNNTDIFIAESDGNNARPLMPDPALDYNASFSPDGQWIVFTSHRSGASDIYRVHADGKDRCGLSPLQRRPCKFLNRPSTPDYPRGRSV